MGKNRIRESLIREIVSIIVHEIVAKHTNRPESQHFLQSEIIEYRARVEKTSEKHNWNAEDKRYIEGKALTLIIEKLSVKYPDVTCSKEEAIHLLNTLIKEIFNQV